MFLFVFPVARTYLQKPKLAAMYYLLMTLRVRRLLSEMNTSLLLLLHYF